MKKVRFDDITRDYRAWFSKITRAGSLKIVYRLSRRSYHILSVYAYDPQQDDDTRALTMSSRDLKDRTAFILRAIALFQMPMVVTVRRRKTYMIEPGGDNYPWIAAALRVEEKQFRYILRETPLVHSLGGNPKRLKNRAERLAEKLKVATNERDTANRHRAKALGDASRAKDDLGYERRRIMALEKQLSAAKGLRDRALAAEL